VKGGPVRYLSVCSGIEAASVAWHPLGWTPVAFAEVDRFPSAVLATRWPGVPNWGDLNGFQGWPDATVDLLVGGTPCQSFSVAGLRKGLDDPRGSLMLTYLAVARRYRPSWVVWENVPGVLSADGGRAFGTLLGGLGELGYGFAYRVLDAQYFGLAQRRARVFVVGCLGSWQRAAAVLFELSSMRGDPPPRRETRQGAPAGALRGTDGGVDVEHGRARHLVMATVPGGAEVVEDGAPCLTCNHEAPILAHALRADAMREGVAKTLSPDAEGRLRLRDPGLGIYREIAPTLDTGAARGVAAPVLDERDRRFWETVPPIPILEPGRRSGRSTSDARVGLGVGAAGDPMFTLGAERPHGVAHAFDPRQSDVLQYGHLAGPLDTDGHSIGVLAFSVKDHGGDAATELAPTLRAGGHAGSHANGGVMPAVAFVQNQRDEVRTLDVAGALASEPGMKQQTYLAAAGMAVRRLTPRECERLQGFPDDYTLIDYRGKPAADGPRYKALGNSMAVPVMRWIGERIALVESIEG
jgi:DNA (cytosine-5)-methyltransferase 1